jgi:hypothetical protein
MPKVWTVTLVLAAATASWGACAGETKGGESLSQASSLLAAQTRSEAAPLLDAASLPATKFGQVAVAMERASKPEVATLSASFGDVPVGTSAAAADTAPTSLEAQRLASVVLSPLPPVKLGASSLTLDLTVEKGSDRFGAAFSGGSPTLGR